MLAPVTGFLPVAWSEDARVLAVLLGGGVVIIAVMVLAAWLIEGRRARPVMGEADAPEVPQVTESPVLARGPDLDPEEWISGNVVHLDRHRAVGFIRCDRVKRPVRFAMPALGEGAARGPRVGDKVRFKGRHGARRRPVADVVERAG